MDIQTVTIEKPEAIKFILGQSHFIKTVEDIHEAFSCKEFGTLARCFPRCPPIVDY